MNVLHVNEHLACKGGVETYLLSMLPLLEQQGVSTAVAYATGDESLVARSYCAPMLAKSGRQEERAGYRQLAEVLRREQPDCVHLHGVYNIGAVEACLQAAPVVVTGHDYRYLCPASTFYFRRTNKVCERDCAGPGCFTTTIAKHCLTPRPKYALAYYRRTRWFVRNRERFAGLIAPSRYSAERFLRAGFPENRVTVLPYFCSLPPLAAPRTPPAEPTVLYLGRLAANKGYRQFVRAVGRLPSSVRGVMIGNFTPETEREVKELAAESGCGSRLECRPWAGRNEIDQVMKRATLLVFPSLWAETLGIVGLEALAMGVPVVASDIGGVREWLHDGETGLLAPAGDVAALASAMERLLDDQERCLRMGAAGIDLIRRKFLPEDHVAQLMDCYRRAVGDKEPANLLSAIAE